MLARRSRLYIFVPCIIILILYITYIKLDEKDWNRSYVSKILRSKLSLGTQKEIERIIVKEKNKGFILDTPGCKIPKFDPFDPSVVHLYEPKETYGCKGPPLFLISKPGGIIALNKTVLEKFYHLKRKNIFCIYQGIRRKYEKPGDVRENAYELTDYEMLKFNVPLKEDHIKVLCDLGGKENFTQYIPLVRVKEEIEEMKTRIPEPKSRLNVIVVGIDSISKLNFLRHFRKTHKFVRENGNFFEMKGYVKVGDNTFPNLTPLLTGQHVETIWNETLKDTMFFDDVDIIWKKYSQKGYRTFYAEDSPFFGTFNYGRRGFNNTPTDYYMRPLYLAMHNSDLRKKNYWYCLNSQLEPEIMNKYLIDFITTMGRRPYFAFAMESSLTHDYLNHAGYADYPMIDLLNDMWELGALNDSVLVIFGDHGLRFGEIRSTYIGKYEERMPFLYIHFPTWFLQQNPKIHQHLKDNTERLVTLFDVYVTFVHLLDPTKKLTPQEKSIVSPYGLSLMEEISPYRTCEKAGIFPHWCTCHVFQDVSPEDQETKNSIEAILLHLRNITHKFKGNCEIMTMGDIKEVKLSQLNDLVLRFLKHEGIIVDRSVWYGNRIVKYEYFWVTITTKPCGDVIESAVRHNVNDDSYEVLGINRINFDIDKHHCINDEKVKPFCCCK